MHQLEAEAAKGKLGGTSATLTVLLDRYLEHLERKGLSPKTSTRIASASRPRSSRPSVVDRSRD